MIFNQSFHLLLDAFMPLGDIHVQGVVAAGLAVCPFSPLVKRSQQTGPRLRNHVVDWEKTREALVRLAWDLSGVFKAESMPCRTCC